MWIWEDAQEFLMSFLNGLSEDVNRVVKKEYAEIKDSDRRPDTEVAAEWWEKSILRRGPTGPTYRV